MEPNEIKAELVRNNVTCVEIAKEARCTKQYVSAIIKKKRTNPNNLKIKEIQEIIARKIQKSFSEVWVDEK